MERDPMNIEGAEALEFDFWPKIDLRTKQDPGTIFKKSRTVCLYLVSEASLESKIMMPI